MASQISYTGQIMENNGILSGIRSTFGVETKDVRSVPALTLAYVGDCIYELIIRSMLVESGIAHVAELNKKSSSMVRASAQCEMYRAVEEMLSEEEAAAFRRGRNVKSSSIAKHATVADYRCATGYEALMGYLYLNERYDRILELVKIGLDSRGISLSGK